MGREREREGEREGGRERKRERERERERKRERERPGVKLSHGDGWAGGPEAAGRIAASPCSTSQRSLFTI